MRSNIRGTEAYKQERIGEAKGQVARFIEHEEVYKRYSQHPRSTKERMHYEGIEEMLPGAMVYINGADG